MIIFVRLAIPEAISQWGFAASRKKPANKTRLAVVMAFFDGNVSGKALRPISESSTATPSISTLLRNNDPTESLERIVIAHCGQSRGSQDWLSMLIRRPTAIHNERLSHNKLNARRRDGP